MSTATPPADSVPLEVDEAAANDTDTDSSIGSDEGGSTSSINSSIFKYRQEYGRTFHAYKDGQYLMPNDEREQDRLDLQHHLFLITFDNKLHLSPAGRDGHRIHNALDVGTGTGLWAMDFAEEHPDTSVVGIDLSPIQSSFVPPNVSFQIDDIEEPWTFNTNFDFVYCRMMSGALANWEGFFAKAYDTLAPGGWVEVADIKWPMTSDDGTLKEDSATIEWAANIIKGTNVIGRPCDLADKYTKMLEAQGFINVREEVFKWPQNTWPKDEKYKELGKSQNKVLPRWRPDTNQI